MTQALYRKWRPALWEEVIGQDPIVQTLKNAVKSDRVAHAYLFAGSRGTGKTTCARLLAKAVNCLEASLENRPCNHCANCLAVNEGRFMDLIEIDAASNTSVDDIRDLRDKITFSPSQGKFKVYIIDEVHMLSTSAFNALLKTLEEPPVHVIFILATTEIHKIPATVISRCQRYEFRRIPTQLIKTKLRGLCDEEGIEVEDETLMMIARQSTGSMRDAIALVDQLSSMSNKITLEVAQDMMGTATNMAVLDLVSAFIANDHAKGLTQIQKTLDAGSDPRQFARQIVDYLRSILLVKMGLEKQVDAPLDVKTALKMHAAQLSTPQILEAINAFSQAATDLKANWHPGLGLELAYTQLSIGNATIEVGQSLDEGKVSSPAEKVARYDPPHTIRDAAPRVEPEQKKAKPAQEVKPPAITTTSTPETQGPVSTGELGLPLIQQNWKEIKEAVRQSSPKTVGLVNSANLLGVQNKTLLLGFSSEVVRNMMLTGEHIDILVNAIKQVLGREMKVNCIHGKNITHEILPDMEFDADGMVGTAMRDLGGKITDIKKKK